MRPDKLRYGEAPPEPPYPSSRATRERVRRHQAARAYPRNWQMVPRGFELTARSPDRWQRVPDWLRRSSRSAFPRCPPAPEPDDPRSCIARTRQRCPTLIASGHVQIEDKKDVAWEQWRSNRSELPRMPNCLFDCRKMRPKPLRPKVQLGPALTMRQCVNEVPPLVSFKRQTTRVPECNIGPPDPTDRSFTVNMQCCIAKPINGAGQRAEDGRFEARYHPSGESTFHPPKRTTVPPLKGDVSVRASTV